MSSGIAFRIWLVAATLLVGPLFGPSLGAGQAQESSSKKGKVLRQAKVQAAPTLSARSQDSDPSRLAQAVSDGLENANDTYRIGVEDDLQISVWREPELSMPVVVRPDGIITLPLLNDIRVVGLTPKELQSLLTEKLKAFVNEPQVTVIVRAIRSRRVYLIGEAARPGAYPLNGRKTILQLLAEVGGLGPFARADAIYVLRGENGHQVKIPFSYKKAINGHSSARASDIELLPGDIVVVP